MQIPIADPRRRRFESWSEVWSAENCYMRFGFAGSPASRQPAGCVHPAGVGGLNGSQSFEEFGDFRFLGATCEIEEDILQAGLTGLVGGAQLIHAAHGDQLTLVDNPNAVTHALGDLQN